MRPLPPSAGILESTLLQIPSRYLEPSPSWPSVDPAPPATSSLHSHYCHSTGSLRTSRNPYKAPGYHCEHMLANSRIYILPTACGGLGPLLFLYVHVPGLLAVAARICACAAGGLAAPPSQACGFRQLLPGAWCRTNAPPPPPPFRPPEPRHRQVCPNTASKSCSRARSCFSSSSATLMAA